MGKEEILSGGQLTSVIRVGDTVRRPTGPWTPAVHSLLRHLQDKGFEQAPRVLGFDDQDREILTFIPGETVGARLPWPDWVWSDNTLRATGAWLRAYHEAVSDYREKPGAIWRMNWATQGDDEIICHYDVAPYNLVLRAENAVSVIDWDVAAPGSRLMELAKVANSFCGVSDREKHQMFACTAGELNGKMLEYIVNRIELLLDVYDLKRRVGFVDTMMAATRHSCERIRRGAGEGDTALSVLIDKGVDRQLLMIGDLYRKYRDSLVRMIES